jgi:hypothetical protein
MKNLVRRQVKFQIFLTNLILKLMGIKTNFKNYILQHLKIKKKSKELFLSLH